MRMSGKLIEKYELSLVEMMPMRYTAGRRISKALITKQYVRYYWYMDNWMNRLAKIQSEIKVVARRIK